MPTYEYACQRCSHEFEVEQRITEAPIASCPECRSRKVKRLISQTSFVLKGGGWYSDLYTSKGGPSGRADGKSGDSGSSEARPEKKPGGDKDVKAVA